MSTHSTTPTVVVGIGEAGVRMLSSVHDVVTNEDVDDRYFEFLAIDSADDIDDSFPELSDLNQFRINAPPENRWRKMVEETHSPFLRQGDAAASQGGVTRNRPVARALIDDSENFEALHGFLETRISTLIDDLGATNVDIWVLSSLGGGTGSGAFPIVGAMLSDLARELEQEDPQLGFDIAGVGTLPQLTRLGEGHYPNARPRHIINAYTALRELQGMLDHDYSESPLRFKVHAEEIDLFPGQHLPPMREPPFERYFLFPVKESEIRNEDSRERMNEIVADLILYFTSITGVEDYPDTEEEYDDEVLFTLNAAELSFPTDLATEYVEVAGELKSLNDRKRKLNRLEDNYESNRNYLSSVLDVNRGEMPDGDVERRLVSDCHDAAEETIAGGDVRYVDEDQLTNDASTIVEETRSEVRSRIEQFDATVEIDGEVRSAPEDVPMMATDGDDEPVDPVDTVIEYFYYVHVIEAAKSELERRQYEQLVDEGWAEHRRDIRQYASDEEEFERVDQGSADEKWETLEPFLEYQHDEIEEELEDGGIFSLGFGDSELEEEREDIEKLLSDIRDARERHNKLEELRAEANKRRQTRRDTLQTLRDQFEDAAASVEDEIDDLEHDRRKLEHKRDRLTGRERGRTSLTEFNPEQFAEMALEDPSSLTAKDLDEIANNEWSLDDLTAAGLTSREKVLKNFEYLLTRKLNERMSDKATTRPDGLLATLRHDENSWLDEEIINLVNSRQTRIEHVTDSMPIADRLTVRLLSTYAPIDLMETSEFGVLYEAHEASDERVIDLLMSGDEADEIEEKYVRFAYPELIADGGSDEAEPPEATGTTEASED
jgi:hypothetical protein